MKIHTILFILPLIALQGFTLNASAPKNVKEGFGSTTPSNVSTQSVTKTQAQPQQTNQPVTTTTTTAIVRPENNEPFIVSRPVIDPMDLRQLKRGNPNDVTPWLVYFKARYSQHAEETIVRLKKRYKQREKAQEELAKNAVEKQKLLNQAKIEKDQKEKKNNRKAKRALQRKQAQEELAPKKKLEEEALEKARQEAVKQQKAEKEKNQQTEVRINNPQNNDHRDHKHSVKQRVIDNVSVEQTPPTGMPTASEQVDKVLLLPTKGVSQRQNGKPTNKETINHFSWVIHAQYAADCLALNKMCNGRSNYKPFKEELEKLSSDLCNMKPANKNEANQLLQRYQRESQNIIKQALYNHFCVVKAIQKTQSQTL